MNVLMSKGNIPEEITAVKGTERLGNPVEWYFAEFERVRPELAGADIPWVEAARRRALIRFGATGFPTQRDEDWKYTSLTPIESRTFKTALCADSRPIDETAVNACRWGDIPYHELVFINGHLCESLSRMGRLPRGVRAESLAKALARQEDPLYEHIHRQTERPGDAIAALNAAFMNDGAFIQIAADVVVEDPIHLLFLATNEGLAAYPRIFIDMGTHARAQVVESYQSLGTNSGLTNTLTEVLLNEGAELEHAKLQIESQKHYHFGHLFVRQGRDSRWVSHSISLGAALARHDVTADLDGEGASVLLNGLYMAEGRQHMDHHTRIDHLKPRTRSEELYKGLLDGHARGVFKGQVVVHREAQQSDAQQSNKNLLLSANAEADTKPELQIHADDVKCSHGATVGQLDEDALFYLRARGIDKAQAQGLLIYAFAKDVVSRIGIPPLRSLLEMRLAGQLHLL